MTTKNNLPALLPHDENLLKLDLFQLEFLRHTTGIEDEEDIRRHILKVQAEAYEVYPYGTIRSFTFLGLGISRNPAWEGLLEMRKSTPGAVLLDIGCCFGTDVRKAALDGWPASQIVATDIVPGFWELGHRLFRSSEASTEMAFLAGDILDEGFLGIFPPTPIVGDRQVDTTIALKSLTSLSALRGRASAIYVSAVFHLFAETAQTHLARALAGLLAAHAGATVFGWSAASTGADAEVVQIEAGVSHAKMWCHSPASWTALWEGILGGRERVEVSAEVQDFEGDVGMKLLDGRLPRRLVWSVRRK